MLRIILCTYGQSATPTESRAHWYLPTRLTLSTQAPGPIRGQIQRLLVGTLSSVGYLEAQLRGGPWLKWLPCGLRRGQGTATGL